MSLQLPLELPTPFGVATFTVRIDADGTITGVDVPLAGLPGSAYRLTYGKLATEAQDYFGKLAHLLPDRIRVAAQSTSVPAELEGIVGSMHHQLAPGDWQTGYFREHPEWAGLYGFEEEGHQRLLRRLLKQAAGAVPVGLFREIYPYLLRWLPLAPHRTAELIYRVIGHAGVPTGRDYLLDQLSAPGRHPFTAVILRSLRPYTDEGTLGVLREAYSTDRIGPERVADYLRYLGRFAGADLPDHIEEVLARHPYEPEAAAAAWLEYGLTEPGVARRLRQLYERTDNYAALNDLLLTVNRYAGAAGIDLAAVNRRQETADWLELPPVNWPQQLEPAWRQLVLATPVPEVLRIVTTYLGRSEARLQRNTLLQLRVLLEREDAPGSFSNELEVLLRETLSSPYDKVYVEALNVLGSKPERRLNEPFAMLDAVMARSLTSRYRIVFVRALRRIGSGEGRKRHARAFYRRRIEAASTEGEIRQIAEWLPYLRKYLRESADLKSLLEHRRDRIATRTSDG